MQKMNDDSLMPFGKYQGEKMANIPASYLLWLFENSKCYGEVKAYIKGNLDVLKAEINYESKKGK